MQTDRGNILRRIPSVDVVLESHAVKALVGEYPRSLVVSAVRSVLEQERRLILEQSLSDVSSLEQMALRVREILVARTSKSMKQLVNATGVVLHTNIGRAVLAESAVEAITQAARHYTNLEYDVEQGQRSTRQIHLQHLLCESTSAEAAHVVNNNAGAVLLGLNTLGEGREVIVSRGELVEIGGSFRLPEVMAKSGAVLVEVGTTNRTTIEDYEKAISSNTALFLKVHKSNFRMVGFVSEASLEELVNLGRKRSIPVMEDLGSGAIVDFAVYGLPGEPVVSERIAAGADIVTFSGDKLLGGPQAGIIVGKKELVGRMRDNPLSRALRIDKFTVTALESTLLELLSPSAARERIPSLRMITDGEQTVRLRAEAFLKRIETMGDVLSLTLEKKLSQIGGGALPEVGVPTWAIAVRSPQLGESSIERILREGQVPVLARVEKEAVYIDLRTVLPEEEQIIEEALGRVAQVARGDG